MYYYSIPIAVCPEEEWETPTLPLPSKRDFDFRTPTRLYVTHGESGANAKEVFLKKIDSAQVEIIQPEDSFCPMTCTPPAPHDAIPDAAMISLLDFRAETGHLLLL